MLQRHLIFKGIWAKKRTDGRKEKGSLWERKNTGEKKKMLTFVPFEKSLLSFPHKQYALFLKPEDQHDTDDDNDGDGDTDYDDNDDDDDDDDDDDVSPAQTVPPLSQNF